METPANFPIEIYTDGSCHTQHCVGGWAAIIFPGEEKIILSGKEKDTTHNRMELVAVIKAIEFVKEKFPTPAGIKIISDSQYVINLAGRKEKLETSSFTTKKGSQTRNADLVKIFLDYSDKIKMTFVKVKAHQKKNEKENFNIEADKLSRKIVRDAVKEMLPS